MRWWILFFIILAALLLLTGVVEVPESIRQRIPPSIRTDIGHAADWVRSAGSSISSVPAISSGTPYEYNECTFHAPSDWTSTNKTDSLWVNTPGKNFGVVYVRHASSMSFDSVAFSNFILSMTANADFKPTSQGPGTFQGRDAYIIDGHSSANPAILGHVIVFHANGHGYWLFLEKQDGDPAYDSQLLSILNSVHVTDH